MWFKNTVLSGCLLVLVGCQSTPHQSGQNKPTTAPNNKNTVHTPDSIQITPYDREEIKREKVQVLAPKQAPVTQSFDNGRNLPAFKQLMSDTQTAFQQGKWQEAEQSAIRAQRLAPQSAETYIYLAMIANHKNQASNAESLARRGLSYAQSDAMKRQLWQVILKSAQLQNKSSTIQEAQTKIKSL